MEFGEKEEKKESKIRLCFIRHGETEGNLEKKYVGRTDEPLSSAGMENLRQLKALIWGAESAFPPNFLKLYISPMRRCRESAQLLFPSAVESGQTVFDFRECDFGAFEYCNCRELMADERLSPLYQAWIDSGGVLPFPGGETVDAFKKRCVLAFEAITAREKNGWHGKTVVFVVHGGTIMSILEAYGRPKKSYYDYQVPCAAGYVCDYLPERSVITNIVRLR